MPEGAAGWLAVRRLSSRALGRRILGMRVALGFHSAALELKVDHLADGIEQLHTVVKKPKVSFMIFLGVVVVLPFHTIL